MFSRRQLFRFGALSGAFFLSSRSATRPAFAAIPGGTLRPESIPKYRRPLVIPPAMPGQSLGDVDYYEIAVRQFRQQVLPRNLPPTTVWSYGSVNHHGSFNYPAFTIEARTGKPVRVNWINGLMDDFGRYLPHLLPVDPTLHWANPPGGIAGRDMPPAFSATPGPYRGPVPIVTHVHGAHSFPESDGYPEAWYLPAAGDIPADYARTGTFYDVFRASSPLGGAWGPGAAVFQYPNDQPATTLWYHDHALGITRLNVYAGPAGFYLLRGAPDDRVDGILPGPAPALGDPPAMRYYEIPIVIQDRSFNRDGSLFYPDTREFFDGYAGPYIPFTAVPPIWNPEFFGNTMVVNGRTWPVLPVEPRRYRFRFLNGCNARFLILQMVGSPPQDRGPAPPSLPFWQIGADSGFLPGRPVRVDRLLLGPAERADVIVDFTGLRRGSRIYLSNVGPDEPFGGGEPGADFESADSHTTGQVMLFEVGPLLTPDSSTPPEQLGLPPSPTTGPADRRRPLSLNEQAFEPPGGEELPIAALLGTWDEAGKRPEPRRWGDPITENPALTTTEVWEIHNTTEDAHPIHVHLVQFQVIERETSAGERRGPEAWEAGLKDTVIAYPGEITRIRVQFDRAGLFVWHCHILEHEDNEMMRPYFVGPIPSAAVQ